MGSFFLVSRPYGKSNPIIPKGENQAVGWGTFGSNSSKEQFVFSWYRTELLRLRTTAFPVGKFGGVGDCPGRPLQDAEAASHSSH